MAADTCGLSAATRKMCPPVARTPTPQPVSGRSPKRCRVGDRGASRRAASLTGSTWRGDPPLPRGAGSRTRGRRTRPRGTAGRTCRCAAPWSRRSSDRDHAGAIGAWIVPRGAVNVAAVELGPFTLHAASNRTVHLLSMGPRSSRSSARASASKPAWTPAVSEHCSCAPSPGDLCGGHHRGRGSSPRRGDPCRGSGRHRGSCRADGIGRRWFAENHRVALRLIREPRWWR
jgi:hypothetical protein